MTQTKGPDEVFCTACGEPIKRAAELCPECGVRNDSATGVGSQPASSRSTPAHDPAAFETTVSDSWYYAVASGIGLWVVGLAVFSGNPSGIIEDIGGFSILVGWVLLPVSVYYDTEYVRANSRWNPNAVIWVVLMVIWFVNLVAGVVYLYRRHEALGVP